MHYTIGEAVKITGGQAVFRGNMHVLDTVGFDSRRIGNAAGTLFFCLQGKNRNGNSFVGDAYAKGVRNFVVQAPFNSDEFAEANFILAEDPLDALQKLAIFHRRSFTGPVLAITGSNGKTLVKEWLFSLLKNDFIIARSPRSYNSAIGVAISLLGIESVHNMAIVEAGISAPEEMGVLEEMIKPSLGIFTHLGSAHDENFEDLSQKAAEKVKLFKDCDVIVYPYDNPHVKQAIDSLRKEKPLVQTISWGMNEGAKFRITSVAIENGFSTIEFVHRATQHTIKIPFTDAASAENAMSCLCTLSALERWDEKHKEAFEELKTLENRLSFFEGKNGNHIVNDSYSNDTDSLQVALDFLIRQQPGKEHLVILSDLEQSHPDKAKLYSKVAEMLLEKGTHELLAVGQEISKYKDVFHKINAHFFANVGELKSSGILSFIQNKAILIKGARSFMLERIAQELRKQLHQTVLQIDLTALRNNLSYFRGLLKPGTKIMSMVKAFGYGSGSFETAKTLQFMGSDYLAVAYTDEGVALRKAGITAPVMVMNSTVTDVNALVEYDLEPVLFNEEGVSSFAASGLQMKVHVEIDTGMHRLGLVPASVATVFENFPENLKIVSVFSHLSASEMPEHDEFTKKQLEKFIFVCTNIEKCIGYTFLKHIANTGAVLRFPEAHLDMVRLGIGLYGIDPSGQKNPGLETVASLKTSVSQVHVIASGESVGYSRKAIENRERKIATLPIGYADGLWRRLGNGNGGVWINGKLAPYVGNICMDMCMCDVTDIECIEGDEAEIFGKNIPVEKVAEQCGTIAYEILTAVSQRVRREYVGEN